MKILVTSGDHLLQGSGLGMLPAACILAMLRLGKLYFEPYLT